MFGSMLAIVGAAASVVVILLCLIVFIEKLIDVFQDRWSFVRKALIKKMIFRFRMHGDYTHEDLHNLNNDIDALNYIYRKYGLDEPYDKEERKFIREYERTNKFETRR